MGWQEEMNKGNGACHRNSNLCHIVHLLRIDPHIGQGLGMYMFHSFLTIYKKKNVKILASTID